jgi:hypothetical protein
MRMGVSVGSSRTKIVSLYNTLWSGSWRRGGKGREVIVNRVNLGMIYMNFGKGELRFFEPLLKQGMYWFAENTEVGGHRVRPGRWVGRRWESTTVMISWRR